jgi:hypothetical protein
MRMPPFRSWQSTKRKIGPAEDRVGVYELRNRQDAQYRKASYRRPIHLKQLRLPIASTYLFQLLPGTWKNSPDQQGEHEFVTDAATCQPLEPKLT